MSRSTTLLILVSLCTASLASSPETGEQQDMMLRGNAVKDMKEALAVITFGASDATTANRNLRKSERKKRQAARGSKPKRKKREKAAKAAKKPKTPKAPKAELIPDELPPPQTPDLITTLFGIGQIALDRTTDFLEDATGGDLPDFDLTDILPEEAVLPGIIPDIIGNLFPVDDASP